MSRTRGNLMDCWHCHQPITTDDRVVYLMDDGGTIYPLHPKCADHPWPMSEVIDDRMFSAWQAIEQHCGGDSAKVGRMVEALNDIASWDEGAEVNSSFDEPGSAHLARAALAPDKIKIEASKP